MEIRTTLCSGEVQVEFTLKSFFNLLNFQLGIKLGICLWASNQHFLLSNWSNEPSIDEEVDRNETDDAT